ncbi:hypothetical protein Pmani_004668 [Petrolisthes manimaculis]|uniref:Uncharacterized protein n=1 Tax=Petrolisthes manimaculis TaxID=1843537 RepID=A0AAE1QDB0_9EUCA|nr:hypothetical protein Pmani_004668 [Petrolisthes manimaculis]
MRDEREKFGEVEEEESKNKGDDERKTKSRFGEWINEFLYSSTLHHPSLPRHTFTEAHDATLLSLNFSSTLGHAHYLTVSSQILTFPQPPHTLVPASGVPESRAELCVLVVGSGDRCGKGREEEGDGCVGEEHF